QGRLGKARRLAALGARPARQRVLLRPPVGLHPRRPEHGPDQGRHRARLRRRHGRRFRNALPPPFRDSPTVAAAPALRRPRRPHHTSRPLDAREPRAWIASASSPLPARIRTRAGDLRLQRVARRARSDPLPPTKTAGPATPHAWQRFRLNPDSPETTQPKKAKRAGTGNERFRFDVHPRRRRTSVPGSPCSARRNPLPPQALAPPTFLEGPA